MDKSGTGPLRVAVIAIFALSCFSLLLFLWLSFGGSVPLKPQGYQVKVAFPDAAQLAEQADVRVAGVTIGKVQSKERDPRGNRTLTTLELERKYAPLKTDARAILRQKTLLGETYVELTTGSRKAKALPEGGRLDDARVAPTVEFDEFIRTFDPDTRRAFQTWQEESARAIRGRGVDLNNAFGNFPAFTESATDILQVLDNRRVALKSLIQDTGTTFEAITRDEAQLRTAITRTADVFDTTAANRERLAETVRVFPTFLDESKATLARLERFAEDTDPLLADLQPTLEDLPPTLEDVRRLSPDLERTFESLDPLIEASETGLPALSRTLAGLTPMLDEVAPFLSQLNPMLQYVSLNQYQVTDFLSTGANATGNRREPEGGSMGHALPQIVVAGSQTLPARTRTPDNRGTAYWKPGALADPRIGQFLTLPSFDCRNAGGEKRSTKDELGCFEQGPIQFQNLTKRFPQVQAESYSAGAARKKAGK